MCVGDTVSPEECKRVTKAHSEAIRHWRKRKRMVRPLTEHSPGLAPFISTTKPVDYGYCQRYSGRLPKVKETAPCKLDTAQTTAVLSQYYIVCKYVYIPQKCFTGRGWHRNRRGLWRINTSVKSYMKHYTINWIIIISIYNNIIYNIT